MVTAMVAFSVQMQTLWLVLSILVSRMQDPAHVTAGSIFQMMVHDRNAI